MKKSIISLLAVIALAAVCGAQTAQAQTQTVSLDNAIKGAAEELSYGFKRGNNVAVLAIRSGNSGMSDYLINELNRELANLRMITVVERGRVDELQDEYVFKTSADLYDRTAQAIGRRLEAQTLITGTLEQIGDSYHLTVKVLETWSDAPAVAHSANVQNDQTVAVLMAGGGIAGDQSGRAASDYEYKDFTTGQRWGTWLLNEFIFPGLGSWAIMHDGTGGTALLASGIAGWGFFGLGMYQMAMDNIPLSVVYFVGGGLILVLKEITNIILSAHYSKPYPSLRASVFNPDAWNLAVMPGPGGIERVQVAYNMRF